MKMITAIIQPFMLSKVTHALERIERFPGMTVSDVQGFGREKATHERDARRRSIDEVVDFVKKTRLDIVAHDEMTPEIVRAIASTAHTGNRGDGKIFVQSLEDAVRIKTGDTGEAAIS